MDGLSVQEVLSWTWTCIGKNWIECKEEIRKETIFMSKQKIIICLYYFCRTFLPDYCLFLWICFPQKCSEL